MNHAPYETLLVDDPTPGVRVLTLNRPDHGNGVVPTLARELFHALARATDDDSVGCLVLTGAGRQFCAGADLRAFKEYLDDESGPDIEPYNIKELYPAARLLATGRLPAIAAVNGGATAGGFDLALACDIRIASDRAKLGETYVNVGLVPGTGGTYFLPRLVGSGRAAELAFTGDVIDASTAEKLGLVNRVVPAADLLSEAIALATRIAAKPRKAIEMTRQALRASWHHDLHTALEHSYWAVSVLHNSTDLREGIDAFLEKRPPVFNR